MAPCWARRLFRPANHTACVRFAPPFPAEKVTELRQSAGSKGPNLCPLDRKLVRSSATGWSSASCCARAMQRDRARAAVWQAALRPRVSLRPVHAANYVAPGGSLHVVDFGDTSALPQAFKGGPSAFLRPLHTPPANLAERIESCGRAHGLTVEFRPVHLEYGLRGADAKFLGARGLSSLGLVQVVSAIPDSRRLTQVVSGRHAGCILRGGNAIVPLRAP